MKTWKPVYSVWNGGTMELLRFKDARVRVTKPCSPLLNDITGKGPSRQILLTPGRIGILTEASMDKVFLGFANDPSAQITSRDSLLRASKGVVGVIVNWPTLKNNFEIEV